MYEGRPKRSPEGQEDEWRYEAVSAGELGKPLECHRDLGYERLLVFSGDNIS